VVGLQTLAFRATNRNATFGPGLRIRGWPIARFARGSRVVFGRNVVLVSHSYFSEPGINHACVIRTLSPRAELIVGDDVGMSGCTICAAERISVGNDCLIGANVLIANTDFHPIAAQGRSYSKENVQTAPVVIGDNVFIGANAMILKGSRIGDNAVIGAGSVVTGDIPTDAVAAGAPARVIGSV